VTDIDLSAEIAGPPIPLGHRVELPGRGTTFVREVAGPPGAPTVLLLHGLLASGGLNWFQVFEPLGRHFRVIAPDLRGHGRGLRSPRRFRLADCADDVAALLDELGIASAIVAGYSMGGPVAQLLWKQHPEKVDGLVMCATGVQFVPGVRERLVFVTAMTAAASSTRVGQAATQMPLDWVRRRVPLVVRARPSSFRRWAAAEMRRHDVRLVMEAANAVGNYDARSWISEVDVPTSLIVTTQDRAIPALQQLKLLLAIPHARVHQVHDGHTLCAKRTFVSPMLAACTEVAEQIRAPRVSR
jgi:pimeloyl-ACP methyl ester carboxylesterase